MVSPRKEKKKMSIVSKVCHVGVLEKPKSVDTPDDTVKFSKIRIHENKCLYDCTIIIQRKIHAKDERKGSYRCFWHTYVSWKI